MAEVHLVFNENSLLGYLIVPSSDVFLVPHDSCYLMMTLLLSFTLSIIFLDQGDLCLWGRGEVSGAGVNLHPCSHFYLDMLFPASSPDC